MPTTLARPPIAPAKPRWNTLQLLKGSRVLLVALDAVFLLAAITAAGVHRNAMQTVAKASAPSIIAAQHIKAALAGMDANAANELLAPAGSAQNAVDAYEARREEAAKELIRAAENITFGESERGPLQTLQIGLGNYERLIQRARDLRERNDAGFLEAWRGATAVLDAKLLPAADALDKANDDVLEREYATQTARSTAVQATLLAMALLLVILLTIVQGYLSRKMKRTINPLLLLATALATGAMIYALSAMSQEQRQLKVSKEDAFTSVRALWRARADAYWANGDESRYLLDPAHASQHEQDFLRKLARLAGIPVGWTFERVTAEQREGRKVTGFTGYLAQELDNITFAGERDRAATALQRLGEYAKIDGRIRRLETSGDHRAAIALCIGTAAGQSDWAFERFDQALGKTIDINQQAFEEAVANGFAALKGLEVKMSAAAVFIGVLVFLGLGTRIREYE